MAEEIILRNKEELKNDLAKLFSQRGYAHLNEQAMAEAFEYAIQVRAELKEARRIMQRSMDDKPTTNP